MSLAIVGLFYAFIFGVLAMFLYTITKSLVYIRDGVQIKESNKAKLELTILCINITLIIIYVQTAYKLIIQF